MNLPKEMRKQAIYLQDCHSDYIGMDASELLEKAADEIERLTHELEQIQNRGVPSQRSTQCTE